MTKPLVQMKSFFKGLYKRFYVLYEHVQGIWKTRLTQLFASGKKNRDHTTRQLKNISKNLKSNLIFPYLSPIPKCPKLSHVAQKRFISKNSKIVKICPNSMREHSKEPPNLKLSKMDRFMNIGHIEKILSGFLT